MGREDKDFVRSFLGMHRQMERFLSDAFRAGHPSSFTQDMAWRPPVDVFETETDYVVKVEVAGVERDRLRVSFDQGQLTVEGCREDTCTRARLSCHQMEIPYGYFKRTVFISRNVDVDGIVAHYEAGFLDVRIPRSQTHPQRKVQIDLA